MERRKKRLDYIKRIAEKATEDIKKERKTEELEVDTLMQICRTISFNATKLIALIPDVLPAPHHLTCH